MERSQSPAELFCASVSFSLFDVIFAQRSAIRVAITSMRLMPIGSTLTGFHEVLRDIAADKDYIVKKRYIPQSSSLPSLYRKPLCIGHFLGSLAKWALGSAFWILLNLVSLRNFSPRLTSRKGPGVDFLGMTDAVTFAEELFSPAIRGFLREMMRAIISRHRFRLVVFIWFIWLPRSDSNYYDCRDDSLEFYERNSSQLFLRYKAWVAESPQ